MPKCPFCNKVLKTDKGFEKHMCEKKKRYVEFDEVAYKVWLMVCNVFHINVPNDDEERKLKFINDRNYQMIIDFKNWVLSNDILNFNEYLIYLSNHNIMMNRWTEDRIYRQWMNEYLQYEPDAIAIKRSEDTLNSLGLTLETINQNRLYLLLKYGKISIKYLKYKNFDVLKFFESETIKDLMNIIFTTEERIDIMIGLRK